MRIFLFLAILLTVQLSWGQCWNPDSNNDGSVGTADLMNFLAAFGSPLNTDCPCDDTYLNYNGHDYEIVSIGSQCWFAENLKTSTYLNGEDIPNLYSGAWVLAGNNSYGAYCSSSLGDAYGYLYNFHAVVDSRGLCPSGWHVPTDEDWMILEEYIGIQSNELGGSGLRGTEEGYKLKASESDSPPWDGNNSTGFTALPAGFRTYNGAFTSLGEMATMWTSTYVGEDYVCSRSFMDGGQISRWIYGFMGDGLSVRCLKD